MSLVFYLIWHWKFLKQFVCFVCDCSTYFASAVSIYCCLIVKRISFKTACTICSLENHKLCYLHFKKLPSYGPFHLISTPPFDEIFRGGLESHFWRTGRVGILWSLEYFLGVWEKWAISEGWDSVSTFDFFLKGLKSNYLIHRGEGCGYNGMAQSNPQPRMKACPIGFSIQ